VVIASGRASVAVTRSREGDDMRAIIAPHNAGIFARVGTDGPPPIGPAERYRSDVVDEPAFPG
jgi:hypothetical protein